jgi:hypothetical protein
VGAVVAIVEPQAVPVDGGLHVALILDLNRDLATLRHLEDGTGDRAVVGEHPHRCVAESLDHRSDSQVEAVTVAKLDHLCGPGLGKAFDLGREVLGACGQVATRWATQGRGKENDEGLQRLL